MPDVVDAQLRLHWQFLGHGRDVMLTSVFASDPAHDPNAPPVEALKKPHVLSIYNPAFRALATWQPKTDQHTWLPIGTIPTGDTQRRRRLGQAPHAMWAHGAEATLLEPPRARPWRLT